MGTKPDPREYVETENYISGLHDQLKVLRDKDKPEPKGKALEHEGPEWDATYTPLERKLAKELYALRERTAKEAVTDLDYATAELETKVETLERELNKYREEAKNAVHATVSGTGFHSEVTLAKYSLSPKPAGTITMLNIHGGEPYHHLMHFDELGGISAITMELRSIQDERASVITTTYIKGRGLLFSRKFED